jgi:hypothetical protein
MALTGSQGNRPKRVFLLIKASGQSLFHSLIVSGFVLRNKKHFHIVFFFSHLMIKPSVFQSDPSLFTPGIGPVLLFPAFSGPVTELVGGVECLGFGRIGKRGGAASAISLISRAGPGQCKLLCPSPYPWGTSLHQAVVVWLCWDN